MKITIDKEYSEGCTVKQIKKHVTEFKATYTDEDLRRIFIDTLDMNDDGNIEFAMNETFIMGGKILYCNLEALGTEYDETSYSVTMFIESSIYCYKLHFFISQSGLVNTYSFDGFLSGKRRYMYSMEKFVLN